MEENALWARGQRCFSTMADFVFLSPLLKPLVAEHVEVVVCPV